MQMTAAFTRKTAPSSVTIAERIGAENFYSYVEKFGYLEKTGIDLPSEASTIFHDPTKIGTTELATASFGQRFKVSIISQITAIAAVANGGNLVEPYLVSKVIDGEGNTVSEHQTVVKGRVVSEEVAMTVSDILEKGVPRTHLHASEHDAIPKKSHQLS